MAPKSKPQSGSQQQQKQKNSSSSSCSCSLTKVLTWVGILIALLSPIVYLLEQNLERFYFLDPVELKDLTERSLAAHPNDTAAIVQYIVAELHEKHPKYINPRHDDPNEWFFNNAGGAMGSMYIIHSSITEYLIIFGTAVGTEGHTGRHTADDFFYILQGEQWTHEPGHFKPDVYPTGSMNLMPRGVVRQYRMPNDCFALEYARGWIPPMLFFGFADTFSSTLDVHTLWRTIYLNGREVVRNLLQAKF